MLKTRRIRRFGMVVALGAMGLGGGGAALAGHGGGGGGHGGHGAAVRGARPGGFAVAPRRHWWGGLPLPVGGRRGYWVYRRSARGVPVMIWLIAGVVPPVVADVGAAPPPAAGPAAADDAAPEEAQAQWPVDDDWLQGAAGWVAEADNAGDCFERLDAIARQGQRFLARQAAALVTVCGDGADAMLQSTALVAPYIVDRGNAAAALLSLFPDPGDQQMARSILRSAASAQ